MSRKIIDQGVARGGPMGSSSQARHLDHRAQARAQGFANLGVLHEPPPRTAEGMLAIADGNNWDPGGGAGLYAFFNLDWNRVLSLSPNRCLTGSGERELLCFVENPVAVNHIEIENGAAGSGPIIRSTGDDADVPLEISTKGSGGVRVNSNLGVNIKPVAEIHIEGAANPAIRIRESTANAGSFTSISHLGDIQAQWQLVNGVTNGNALLDLDPNYQDGGTGNSQLRLFRGTDSSGFVGLSIFRGNNSPTIDHVLQSGTSGVLVNLCQSGGDAQFGGKVGIGVAPLTTLHVEASGSPTIRIRDSVAAAGDFFEIFHTATGLGGIRNTAKANVDSVIELDAEVVTNTRASSTHLNRNVDTSGQVSVYLFRGNNTATIDHAFLSGSSGHLAFLCNNGGDGSVGGAWGIKDGITAPGTLSGTAWLYVDSADGDLKVKFGDGTVKTIATDT